MQHHCSNLHLHFFSILQVKKIEKKNCHKLGIWHAALVAMQLGHQDLSSVWMNYKADGTWVGVGGRRVHVSDMTVCLKFLNASSALVPRLPSTRLYYFPFMVIK